MHLLQCPGLVNNVYELMSMRLTVSHRDVSSRLCRRCAACCRISLTIKNTDTRYRKFLRKTGFTVLPPAEPGSSDCCDKKHDIKIETGTCKHLIAGSDEQGELYSCALYGTPEYPELCADYDCVSWARRDDTYSPGNRILAAAQRALDGFPSSGSGRHGKE